jgi:hypothetical protein
MVFQYIIRYEPAQRAWHSSAGLQPCLPRRVYRMNFWKIMSRLACEVSGQFANGININIVLQASFHHGSAIPSHS